MSLIVSNPFSLKNLVYAGLCVIFFGSAGGGALLFFLSQENPFETKSKKKEDTESVDSRCTFSLGLKQNQLSFLFPRIGEQFLISFQRPNPQTQKEETGSYLIGLKNQSHKVQTKLPSRVYLDISDENELFISSVPTFYWVDLHLNGKQRIEGNAWVQIPGQLPISSEVFYSPIIEPPIQSLDSISLNSPFRKLMEAVCLGEDQFKKKYEDKFLCYGVQISSQDSESVFSFQEDDKLVYQNGIWQKSVLDEWKDQPLARLAGTSSESLIFDGWENQNYVRFSIPFQKSKEEGVKKDLFLSSVRVRSEKQISCKLEKQCFVLRCGDWVVKIKDRWKILKNKEEQEAYKQGQIKGDLFVFEKILIHQGQKKIQGSYFTKDRCSVLNIEVGASPQPSKGSDSFADSKRFKKIL